MKQAKQLETTDAVYNHNHIFICVNTSFPVNWITLNYERTQTLQLHTSVAKVEIKHFGGFGRQ